MDAFYEQLTAILLLLVILGISISSYRAVYQKLNSTGNITPDSQAKHPVCRRYREVDNHER